MAEPKFKAGQTVFYSRVGILADKVKIVSVIKRRILKPQYIIKNGSLNEVVNESALFEVQA